MVRPCMHVSPFESIPLQLIATDGTNEESAYAADERKGAAPSIFFQRDQKDASDITGATLARLLSHRHNKEDRAKKWEQSGQRTLDVAD